MTQRISRLFLLVATIVTALTLTSCEKQEKKVLIRSYGMTGIIPVSFRSLAATGFVVVENQRKGFAIEQMQGTIYRGKEPICKVIVDDVFIYGGCVQRYDIKGKAALEGNVGLVEMGRILADFDPDEFNISLSAKFVLKKDPSKKGGIIKTFRKNNVPMSDFLAGDIFSGKKKNKTSGTIPGTQDI